MAIILTHAGNSDVFTEYQTIFLTSAGNSNQNNFGSDTYLSINGRLQTVTGGTLAEGRTSIATYIDTSNVLQTVAANVAVWENGGLRHEGEDTNLFLRSEELSNAYWQTASNITVTANSIVGPSGATNVEKFTEVATTAPHRISANNNTGVTVTNAKKYAICVVFKKGTKDFHHLIISDNSGTHAIIQYVNVTTGTLGNNTSTGTKVVRNGCNITNIGNGFYRVCLEVTGTTLTSNLLFVYVGLASSDGSLTSYLGDVNQYGYTTNVELKNNISSYIVTTAAAATRTTCALSIPLVLNTNFFQGSAILMRVVAKHANIAGAKSWVTTSTTAEGLIDNGSGALTFKDSAANTATANLTSWSADTTILVAIATDINTGLMSLSASKDNGITWVTSSDTTFVGLTVGADWLFFSANTQCFDILGFKVKELNKSFSEMKVWAKAYCVIETT